jgi:serine/threonine-protein kinase
MTPERWANIQLLFHEALPRAPKDRRTLLDRECGHDEQLREEVLALLAAHDGDGPIGRMGAGDAPTPSLQWIGPYRLVRQIGEGGMGTVYLAERTGEGFSQMVALKLIRSGYADPRLEERLAHERRLLARLEHPGIARLIDGGSTPSGQPYYAMEFVDGCDILCYSDKHALPLRARLKLFIRICEAVHYAHQQLVVHRDLKPGNVVVTPDGQPKLLDFGLAKALEQRDGAPLDATQTSPWLTPAYASPEQLKHDRVSTLTDVYALGVILYELMTGRRPYDVEGLNAVELTRVVCERIPPAPSTVIRDGAASGTSGAALRRLVAGDLDVITLKALAKEPERRYGSAAELAQDIQRYLDGAPVLARPDSLVYRTSKLVRRHVAIVVAGAAVVVFLVGGMSTALWQARAASSARSRAVAALHESQDVSEFLVGLFGASDPNSALGDTAAARELLRRGVAEVERLGGQPAVQARMLVALGRVLENLARYDDADKFYRRALTQRKAALGPVHLDVAETLDRLGALDRRVGKYSEADSLYREALAMKTSLLGPDHPAVAETLFLLGFLMPYLGRMDESEAFYKRALAIQRSSQAPALRVSETMIQLATIVSRRGKQGEAESLLREALALRSESLGPNAIVTAEAKTYLADFLDRVRMDYTGAERLYRESSAVYRASPEAGVSRLTHTLDGLASVAEELGRRGEAEALLREIVDLQRERLGLRHPSVGGALGALAGFLGRQGRLEESEVVRRQHIAILREAMGPEHHAMAVALVALGGLLGDRGRYAEADSVFKVAIAMRERVSGPRHALLAVALADYASLLTKRRRFAEAEASLARALDIIERQYPDEHADAQKVIRGFASLYEKWDRPEDAARYRLRFKTVGRGL